MMKHCIIHIIILMGFVSSIVGQNRIQFILPQNIYTKGEKIVLIIVPQNQNLSELPVTINIRSCESEKVLSQIFIYADSKNYIYEIDQPKDLTEGSYIISASLLAREESKIIEDHANIFHLLDLGLSEKYFTFETNQYQYQNESKAPSVNIKLRQEFQLDPRNSGVLFSVDQRYLYKPSYINYYIEGQLDELHRLYFEGNDLNNVYAFFPRSRKAIKLMQATQMNMSNLPITRESVDGFYLFDTFKSKIKDINPRNPSNVPPAKYNLKLMRKDDIDFINSLADNAAITEKISYLVEDPKEMDREDEYEIIADNNYNLTDFPEFESVPLFLKEVIYPSKIVKSKSGEKEREIVLLSSINKKWYTSKCLLIIDGLTQNNHEVLLQMSWRDISQIKLYRKVETLRTYYSAMGRHGVLEVITKKNSTPSFLITPKIIKNKVFQPIELLDNKPNFRPIQLNSSSKSLIHLDRIGTFDLYEMKDNKIILKSSYKVNTITNED